MCDNLLMAMVNFHFQMFNLFDSENIHNRHQGSCIFGKLLAVFGNKWNSAKIKLFECY